MRVGRPELAAGATLLIVYLATMAPGVTLWDSGEFLSAIHSLGIPHPPGTPLYVLLANVWARLWSPLVGFAFSVNLFSAVCTALACAILARLFVSWTGDKLAAYAAAVCAGATSSVWLSATETEVYAAALLCACILLWLGNKAGQTGRRRWLFLAAYVAGLAWALHLTALLALPAGVYLAARRGAVRELARQVPAILVMFLIGGSLVLFMLVRAHADPAVNQGNPSTLSALVDVLLRRQYAPAPLLPRQAPWFIQIGNLFEYSDWQFALGTSPDPPPSWIRTSVTCIYGVLGAVGFLLHRVLDRRSWKALTILFLTATLGVLAYLNLKAGPSYGAGFVVANAPHEARERDYFFALAFVCWGLWAGFGAVRVMRVLATRTARLDPATKTRDAFSLGGWLPIAGICASFLPILLNWSAVDRRSEPGASEARRIAIRILERAPPRALILARGDNETYPVWYMQEVERFRRDVTVVVVPLLPAAWYRAELERRERVLPDGLVKRWAGTQRVLAVICENASSQQRPVGTAASLAGDAFTPPCETR